MVLDNADLAVLRVNERVRLGGNLVPEETIRRRFKSGLRNFFQLYKPLADSWQILNNSAIENIFSIASLIDKKLEIQNPLIWQNLVENYDGL